MNKYSGWRNSCMRSLEEWKKSIDYNQLKQIQQLLSSLGAEKIWLVGGMVYRNLAGAPATTKKVDYDFVVDRVDISQNKSEWGTQQNKYGNPKFTKNDTSFDVMPLPTIHSIIRRNLPPTIDHYLSGTPLTIQAIAYSLHEDKIIGEKGIHAIMSKTIGINNHDEATHAAERKNCSVREMLEQKANELGFAIAYDR